MFSEGLRSVCRSYTLARTFIGIRPVVNLAFETPSQEGQDAYANWNRILAAAVSITGMSLTTAYADSKADTRPIAAPCAQASFLYQYEVCPWCNKVKAVLDYYNVPYRTIEVNPVSKTELSFSAYKKVPILVDQDGQQLNDSSVIIETIRAQYTPEIIKRGWFGSQIVPIPEESEEVKAWREWADTTFVRLLTLNIYRSLGESFQAMDYVKYIGSFSAIEQTVSYAVGGTIMYIVGRGLPKKYGYVGADVRAEIQAEVNKFIDAAEIKLHVVGTQDFLGGSTPSLADLQVFGMLRAVSSTDTFQFVINETKILPWWRKMIEAVGESAQLEDD